MFACFSRKQMRRCLLAVFSLLASALTVPAHAQVGSARYASFVVDANNGAVLESVNADQLRHPASLTKLMTLYLTFEALRDRRITLNQLVPVSAHAASMEPTKLGIIPGTRLTVEQAILGLVTKSANDAASALGELLGGTEGRFAQMMTLRARALGMAHTTFRNASGLPDPDQWTTARDLAILARHLITDFPNFYRYFSTPSFVWHGRPIYNHDNMLKSYPGADGLKTGYTDASGHNLVTSAVRGGVRLIGVVLGAATNGERDHHMTVLLNQGYQELDIPIGQKPRMQIATRMAIIPAARAAEPPHPVRGPHAQTARAQTLRAANPRLARAQPQPVRQHAVNTAWSVQVGTFSTKAAAHRAAFAARKAADGGEIRVEPVHVKKRLLWRAAVVGLSQSDAHDACHANRKADCLMFRPRQSQVASR